MTMLPHAEMTDKGGGAEKEPANGITQLPEPPELVPALPEARAKEPTPESDQYRQMGIAYTVPAALVAPVIVLTLMGVWLDGRWGNEPSGFTIGGAVLGIVVGVISMLRMASRLGS
jgi:F0F1-type ATP synthase assembly protein I